MEEPRRLGGRYELSHVLGRGGMAEVYLAHDTRLGRTVAVKTLRADLARDPSFQARFRREAQSAASLNHPAIVAVYDTGEDYVDNISIPYIVMEYVDGSTLRELLHSGRKLLPERTLEMCIGILQALEYSHRAGIVHRDIKPANVMLTRTGQVKVMDFGIARAMGDSGMTMTQTAAVIGTAQYLSPEQAKGEQVDARSDLYSAGCLLYELLCVRPPFVGDSPVAVAYQHVREEPQPPSNFDPEITPEMDAIVLKALVKDPDYRYQSADEMRADIEACLDGQPVAAAAAMGATGGYGYPDQGHGYGPQGYDQPTAALRTADPGAQTSMMPPMPPGDGGYGYGDQGHGGYDQGANRRQKKSKASTVLLVAAGILVLVGAILIGQTLFRDTADNRPTVPKLIGQTLERAQKSGDAVGLKVVKGPDAPCDDQPKGNVCKQEPAADTKVDDGTPITVTISTGAPKVAVPSVVNLKFEDAEKLLKEKGLQVDRKPQESVRAAGTVLEQTPNGGEAERNSVVTLTVAKEITKADVPELRGKTKDEAIKALTEAKLRLGSVTENEQPGAAPGTVVDQQFAAGQQLEVGKTVNVTIAKASTQTAVPNFAGLTVDQYKDELKRANLRLGIVTGATDGNAIVVRSDPQPGTQVNTGQTVNLIAFGGGGQQQGGNNNGGGFGGLGG
ncbi:Stk1 family PASTA domain-containing Ser/Thr kinase [Streptomyces sp. NPDC058682]|uniref:Stk1 family PASTA domain-containing Ser/Thr kinase n=1 Tax=unclassified Streptomyces TaxID=2593676 RepID=UPI00225471E8|nr:Stk1 family PASTA domain-containing Ser/Thr kinase [Streptomyces sp. NBC_01214]MCX4800375.1 Stk1 family PASTA domain-containing Ser/Thr kinase [Streptomyces sp. NBC_01214]